MTVEKIVPWYLRKLPELIVLAVLLGAGWYYGHWREQVGAQAAKLKCAEDTLTAIREGNERADAINKTLQDELRKPKSGPVIREVVRANPSACVLAKPVADSLREAIRSANKAAR